MPFCCDESGGSPAFVAREAQNDKSRELTGSSMEFDRRTRVRDGITTALVVAFVTSCGLGSLKTATSPTWEWGIAVVCVAGAMVSRRQDGLSSKNATRFLNSAFLPGALAFCTAIVVAGILNHTAWTVPVAKYAVIFACTYGLSRAAVTPRQVALGLLVLLASSDVGFVIFAIFEPKNLVILGDGRAGWALAWPGVFWKSGIFLEPWLLLGWTLYGKQSNLTFLLAASSTVALDGTRTGLIIETIFVVATVVIVIVKGEASRLHCFIRFLLAIAVILVSHFAIQPLVLRVIEAGQAIQPSVDSERAASALRLLQSDPTRVGMDKAALNGALRHLPFGSGFGSTTVSVDGEPVVVHMTYLQILSDLGVLGLLGYFYLMAIPCLEAFRGRTIAGADLSGLRDFLLPIAVVAAMSVAGLWQPISDEPSEWGVVAVSVAALARYARGR